MTRPQPGGAKTAIIVLSAALVFMVAITAALLVTRWTDTGVGPSPNAPNAPTTDTTPVTTPGKPTFLDGMKQLTTDPNPLGIIGATDNLVVLAKNGGGDNSYPTGVDKATGTTVWQGQVGDCTGLIAGKAIACAMFTDSQRDIGETDWLDAQTGQSLGALDMSGVGPNVEDRVVTSQGLLVIADDGRPDAAPGHWTATIAYFTGPGAPVWTTPVQYYLTWADEYLYDQPFDEGQGLFAWHIHENTYVLDAQTGFLVYQAETTTAAQIFSNRLVCVGYFDGTGTPPPGNQQVDVPGSGPVTVTTCDSSEATMMPLGPGHPDLLIRSDGVYGTPCTHTWASDPASLTSTIWSIDGLCANDMAWDGQSTIYAATADGRAWAFDVNTGKVLWQGAYQTDGTDNYWDAHVSTSAGLVVVEIQSQGILDFPNRTVLRTDNGQPMLNLTSAVAVSDGVLITSIDARVNPAWNVYVPSFGGG